MGTFFLQRFCLSSSFKIVENHALWLNHSSEFLSQWNNKQKYAHFAVTNKPDTSIFSEILRIG